MAGRQLFKKLRTDFCETSSRGWLALIPETVCYAVSSSNAQRHIVVPSEMDDRLDGQIAEISSLVQQQYIFSYGRFGTKLVTLDHTFI
jgi:hypothetical protein